VTRVLRVDPINAEGRVLMDSIQEKENPTPPVPPSPPVPAKSATPFSPPPSPGAALSPSRSLSVASLTLSAEKEAESLQKKNDGNEAMKRNEFAKAIALYTEAIALDPSNMMFYNNRAQAYIKINDFSAAEQDSSVVISSDPRLPNLKALFRRALARKGINTKVSLQEGLVDLNTILNAEPANKEAKLEKSKLQSLLTAILQQEKQVEEQRRVKEEKERLKSMPNSERIVDDSGIVARSTVIKKNKLPEGELTEVASSPRKTLPSTPASSSEASSTLPAASSPSPSVVSRSPSSLSKEPKRVVVATPTIPTEPPKTVYELERVWRGLKNHSALFAQYLAIFKKSTFKKVIKETISPDLISSMLVAVKECLLVTNPPAAFLVLEGLTTTNKFEIMLSILPEEDMNCIRECLEHLMVHVDRARGERVKLSYRM
jgi:tetratricopeptide (TPR) repeat protein